MQTKSIFQVAAISSLLLVISVALNVWNISVIRFHNDRADHAEAAIDCIWNTYNSLKDARTAQREYLLLEDKGHIQTFLTALATIEIHLTTLEAISNDGGLPTKGEIQTLRDSIDSKIDFLKQVIKAHDEESSSIALEMTRLPEGDEAMLRVQDSVQSLIANERSELEGHIKDIQEAYSFATWAGVLSGMSALASIIALILLVKRSLGDRDRSNNQLQSKSSFLETTLSNITEGVIACDPQGRVSEMNPEASRLTGWTYEDAAGQPLAQVLAICGLECPNPSDLARFRADSEQQSHSQQPLARIVTKQGNKIPIILRILPLYPQSDDNLACVVTIHDMTGQIARESELKDSEVRYRTTFENAAIGICHTFVSGKIVRANKRFCEILGYSQEEITQLTYEDITLPNDIDHSQTNIKKVLSGELPYHRFQKRYVCKSGKIIWANLTFTLIRDTQEPDYFLSIIEDITDRVQAQEALKKNEALLRSVLDNSVALISVLSPDGKILDMNLAALTNCKLKRQDYLGRSLWDLEFWNADTNVNERLRKAIASVSLGEIVRYDEVTKDIEGHDRHMDIIVKSSRGADGMIAHVIVTALDITERKELEQEVRVSAEELSLANKRKDEFIATLSHELRNPLAPIRTGLALLCESFDASSEDRETLDMMVRQTRHLSALIDDLLDVSRISRGKLVLRKQVISLQQIVQNALEVSFPAIDSASHKLSVSLPERPLHVNGDPNRLTQVVSNILTNAAKYTPSGGEINLTLSQKEDLGQVSIRDNGIGIPIEKLDYVFEMFGQIRQGDELASSGLGIGLTLSRDLMAKHGGDIFVKSDGIDKGSEFIVSIPLVRVVQKEEPMPIKTESQTSVDSKEKKRIIVADDSPAILKTISMLFRLKGHDVLTAEDGQEAVEKAADFAPDIIFLDLGMPILSGYDTARKIRQQEWGAGITLVALTGWGGSETESKTKEAGFDLHVVKPPEPDELLRIVEQSAARA